MREPLKKTIMARFSKGILGSFRGTIGTVVGSTWRGISYMRSKPGKRKGMSSKKQLDQQARFALMAKCLQSMKEVIHKGFSLHAKHESPINSALSYNLKNAVTGGKGDALIHYELLLISRGDLPNASTATATASTAGKIHFSWLNNAGSGKAAATDQAMLVAYCASTHETAYTLTGGLRSALQGELTLSSFTGKKVDTWISFISANGKDISMSSYTGQVLVA